MVQEVNLLLECRMSVGSLYTLILVVVQYECRPDRPVTSFMMQMSARDFTTACVDVHLSPVHSNILFIRLPARRRAL